ncbi:hypothetical protein KIN20_016399 [Parelaphostrongylus tenuis]|uniref:Uncharacterized protein n=1 Tax=Parelaphostrongylus tenuis TaxID=148309 RepID=A0AAD5QQQ4_PARTN|nr:hypothetical protein KIN20_016399 [Parelaphostrongylus tenuis]
MHEKDTITDKRASPLIVLETDATSPRTKKIVLRLVDVLGRESPVLGSRTRRAEALAALIRNRLEKMIGHNFIIYGAIEDMRWTVKGLENLKDNVEEMHLQMRLNVDAWKLKLMAFKVFKSLRKIT